MIWRQRLLHIGDPDGDVVGVAVRQLRRAPKSPAATSRIRAPEFISLGFGQPGRLGLAPKPTEVAIVSQQPRRPQRQSSPPIWTNVWPEFAPRPGDSAVEMAVEIERAAEHLARIDHRKLRTPAALAEPAVADQQRARVMVETHRQIEFAAEFFAERKAVERRREIDRDDRAPVGVDHRRRPRRRRPAGFRVAAARADRIDFLIALMIGRDRPVPFRQRNSVLADDRAIEGDEARLHCVRHEQHPADRACARGKPERSRRLAAASLGPAGLGFDEHIVVDQRLDDAGNRRPVDARAASQFGAARWSQIEQRLYDEPTIRRSHHR